MNPAASCQRETRKPASRTAVTRRGFLTAALAAPLLGGCRAAARDEIRLAYVNWADATALTYLARAVLQEKLGYEVEVTMADAAPVFTSVADGGHDAFLSAWLPVTHADYMEKYGDRLVDLGPNYVGTRIGLVVPAHVAPQSLDELNSYRDLFHGEIIGIDAGAGIMRITEQAIDAYDLQYTLLPSSEAAMTASLKDAVDKREAVVVTGWKPHWMFARWPLRFLQDPREVYGRSENIHTVVRPGFVEDRPDVAAFLRRYRLNAEQLQDLMERLRRSHDRPTDVAVRWMREHEDVVNGWVDGIESPSSPPSP